MAEMKQWTVADSGILHSLLGVGGGNDLLAHPKCGASLEGFMIREIIRRTGAGRGEVFFWGVHTGLRPGEKMYEELITEGEGIVRTGHEKIMVLRGNSGSLDDLHESLETSSSSFPSMTLRGLKPSLAR